METYTIEYKGFMPGERVALEIQATSWAAADHFASLLNLGGEYTLYCGETV